MNSNPAFQPTRMALVILYLCASSFMAHLCFINFTYSIHQEPLLLFDSSVENETIDSHAHEDDMHNAHAIILGILAYNNPHEWGALLPTATNQPKQLTPPPKSI
jgi:hypothetical protein